MALASNHIYLWKNGQYDHSRWMTLVNRSPDACVFHLSDLCQPGTVSRFNTVSCPTSYLLSAVERGGSLQITLPTGFLLIQRTDKEIHLEFRATEDSAAVKASFRVEDILERLAVKDSDNKMALSV